MKNGEEPDVTDGACIILTPDGLAFTAGPAQVIRWQLRWQDVVEIVAWKEDLLTIDLLCLGFRVRGDADYLQCNEQQSGWSELCAELKCRFQLRADWWSAVVFPPFQKNWNVLWGRP
jgi:hypothetical protein